MGQQAGFFMDDLGDMAEVVERGRETHLGKRLACGLVTQLGFFSQCEECFFATHLGAVSCDLEYFVDRHERRFQFSRDLCERAVVTDVATQMCQRNENFA